MPISILFFILKMQEVENFKIFLLNLVRNSGFNARLYGTSVHMPSDHGIIKQFKIYYIESYWFNIY
jgi:hypothetical protein